MTEQLTLDFGLSDEWSDENLCLCWVTGSDGRHWKDWWIGLKNYERSQMMINYRFERKEANEHKRPMRPHLFYVISPEELKADRDIIDLFKRELFQASLERRTMPLSEGEDMTPMERLTFRHRLECAMRETGVVIVEAAPAEPKKRR